MLSAASYRIGPVRNDCLRVPDSRGYLRRSWISLRETPVMYLTETDKKLQRDAALFVLEHAQPTASREWRNPLTGFSGRIEGQGDLISDPGLRCRKIKVVAQVKGAESVFVVPLCKDASGEWLFASALKLHARSGQGPVATQSVLNVPT